MIKNVKKIFDEKPKFVKKKCVKFFFNIIYHISSFDRDMWSYSTSAFVSKPQQFADISEIIIRQFIQCQELKNTLLFFKNQGNNSKYGCGPNHQNVSPFEGKNSKS